MGHRSLTETQSSRITSLRAAAKLQISLDPMILAVDQRLAHGIGDL